MNNPAIKRLARELQELKSHSHENLIEADPLKEDLFEWHFTLLGPEDSVFANGRYHGRIQFPADYPFSPPSIFFLTPNGRWEVDKKICLSVTGFHPESWQPAWSIRTILLALRDHFTVDDKSAIGYLDYSPEARTELASKSRFWKCSICGFNCKSAEDLGDVDTAVPAQSLGTPEQRHEPGSVGLWIIATILLILALLTSYIYLSIETSSMASL